jgi:hypothetical protein
MDTEDPPDEIKLEDVCHWCKTKTIVCGYGERGGNGKGAYWRCTTCGYLFKIPDTT